MNIPSSHILNTFFISFENITFNNEILTCKVELIQGLNHLLMQVANKLHLKCGFFHSYLLFEEIIVISYYLQNTRQQKQYTPWGKIPPFGQTKSFLKDEVIISRKKHQIAILTCKVGDFSLVFTLQGNHNKFLFLLEYSSTETIYTMGQNTSLRTHKIIFGRRGNYLKFVKIFHLYFRSA